jgi:signal transduction histidine kinase/CheY-like chemotaxis protein/HPt (histidine-containing phosphotransfer) domain-containing protein
MASHDILESFLSNQGFALFEPLGDGAFGPVGHFPEWLERIWGTDAAHAVTVRVGKLSPFLDNFLYDAEEFWQTNAEGSVKSGNWTERGVNGVETPMEAAALRIEGRPLLLVQNFSSAFAEQQQILQTARDGLLEHERLMREIQKKEILLHCIIHDLSQPLSAMRGCFNCLTIGDLPDDLRPFVETGQRESYRQEQMIRGILEAFSGDLAAQQRQGNPGAASAVDLVACAEQAVKNFSAAFTEKGVQLRLDPVLDRSRDWTSVGDAGRVDRIFGNLLENAMRYSPRGSGVTVGVEDKGGVLNAFVDDEGPGLPKDQSQDKLFALFAKGNDRAGKAGLGLYFCKMTVERWGGRIGAETRPVGGSRFWFRLPRSAAAAEAAKHAERARAMEGVSSAAAGSGFGPAQSAARRKGVGKALRTLRILVADDTEVNRELAMELLKKRGHTVFGVCDGRGALAALEKQQFDVVLIDEVMPVMSGFDTMRKIREREAASGKHQIIIGLTGNATQEDEKRLLDAGMDGFLSKPFDMYRLFALVESLANGAQRGAGMAELPIPPPAALPSVGASAEKEDVAQHLSRTTGGNQKLIQSLVKSFLADAPKKLADVHRAIARQDAARLASAAHALKGAIAIFGAAGAVMAAKNLEALGRADRMEGASREFEHLEGALHRLEQQLRDLRPGTRASVKPKRTSAPQRPRRR